MGIRARRGGGEDANEAHCRAVRAGPEGIVRHRPSRCRGPKIDLRLERKGCRARAQLRLRPRAPDHEGAGRADVHRAEMLKLFGECGRPEAPVAPDVDASQKDDECHVPVTRSPSAADRP
jgi:hypothetical protein